MAVAVNRYPNVVARVFEMDQAMASSGSMSEVAKRHNAKEILAEPDRGGLQSQSSSSPKGGSKWSALRQARQRNDLV